MQQVRAEEGQLHAGADEERGRADDDVLHVFELREAVEGESCSIRLLSDVERGIDSHWDSFREARDTACRRLRERV